jgi:hypothetical protein
MRRPFGVAIVGALLCLAAPLDGQQARSISTGMTTDDVRSTFGAPSVVRETDGWTYFFYTSRCPHRCGTDDTVFFRDGQVVAAVLHAPTRRFSGPPAAQAIAAAGPAQTTSSTATPATVSGLRVRTSGGEEQSVNLGEIRGRPPTRNDEPDADEDGVLAPDETISAPARETAVSPRR